MELTTADRLEILELLARCTWASDSGDTARWLATFTPDAQLTGLIGGRLQVLTGHQELASIPDGRTPNDGRHWSSNHVLDVEGDRVHHRSYWSFIRSVGAQPRLLATGTYADVLVRHDGRWKLQQRTVTLEPMASQAAS